MVQARYKFKAELAARKRAYENAIVPTTLALAELEMAMGAELDRLDTDRERTPLGVVYFSYPESVRVIDRFEFFAWVVEYNAFDCLTSHVSKKALRERGVAPPGISVTLLDRKICVERD